MLAFQSRKNETYNFLSLNLKWFSQNAHSDLSDSKTWAPVWSRCLQEELLTVSISILSPEIGAGGVLPHSDNLTHVGFSSFCHRSRLFSKVVPCAIEHNIWRSSSFVDICPVNSDSVAGF